jgi:hypothetical protein
VSATLRIERVVTRGTFALDGGTWDVENNIWLVGDDSDVVIIDAAHQAQPIVDAVAGRNVTAVICTHGHNDHVTVAPELGERLHCPVLLHPGDDVLSKMTHPEEPYWRHDDGQRIGAADLRSRYRTPGTHRGRLYVPEAGDLTPATLCSAVGLVPPDGRSLSHHRGSTAIGSSPARGDPYTPARRRTKLSPRRPSRRMDARGIEAVTHADERGADETDLVVTPRIRR